MRSVAWSFYVCGAVVVSQSFGEEAGESALVARLREEAPAAWRRLELKYQQTRFEWKETRTEEASGKREVSTNSGFLCRQGEDFLIRIDWRRGPEVWGGNRRYVFSIKRASDEGLWALGDFESRDNKLTHSGDDLHGWRARIPFTIREVPCSALIADPGFRVQGLDTKSDGAVEVRFSMSGQQDESPKMQLSSGRIVLLPDRDWAVSEYQVNLTRKSPPATLVGSATAEYGPEEGSFLNLVRTTWENRWQSRGKQGWVRWETDLTCQRCSDPPESFTLAAFGLPEPALPGERKRLWLWLNIAAVAFLLVAFILRLRRKARQA